MVFCFGVSDRSCRYVCFVWMGVLMSVWLFCWWGLWWGKKKIRKVYGKSERWWWWGPSSYSWSFSMFAFCVLIICWLFSPLYYVVSFGFRLGEIHLRMLLGDYLLAQLWDVMPVSTFVWVVFVVGWPTFSFCLGIPEKLANVHFSYLAFEEAALLISEFGWSCWVFHACMDLLVASCALKKPPRICLVYSEQISPTLFLFIYHGPYNLWNSTCHRYYPVLSGSRFLEREIDK
jgi:hypothetical protein